MSVWRSSGVVRYDPKVERGSFVKWWVILQCDRELVRYYQHIFYKLYWRKLQTQLWGAHCSLVRGEEPLKPGNWKKYAGKVIEFEYEYDGEFLSNYDKGGRHFWLKVWSAEFGEIRQSLGLTAEPKIPFHISIGSLNQ